MPESKIAVLPASRWPVGSRISRDGKSGTLVEVGNNRIEVKWDEKRTSYYLGSDFGNIRRSEDGE